jgi:hypothetical protein
MMAFGAANSVRSCFHGVQSRAAAGTLPASSSR